MPSSNIAAILYGRKDLRLDVCRFSLFNIKEPRQLPEVGSNDVLIAIKCVGICGSDYHFWKHGQFCNFTLKQPITLGHEGSGIIVQVGSNVSHLKPGDKVAIEQKVGCTNCQPCLNGRTNICDNPKAWVTTVQGGLLANYHVHPSHACFRLPENVSLDEGALMEPLCVAIHACNRAEVKAGDRVLICGSGTIGLMVLLVAKAAGATGICITALRPTVMNSAPSKDTDEYRLGVAKQLGADCVVKVDPLESAQSQAAQIISAFAELRPNVSFECSGAETPIQAAILATKPGGVVAIVGLGCDEAKLPIVSAAVREIDLRWCFAYANCYPVAVDLVSSGRVDLSRFITHRFKLVEVADALKLLEQRDVKLIKILIDCSA